MQRVDFDLVFKFVTLSWKWILEMFSAYRWWAATCGEEKTRAQWCMRRSNRRHTRFFFRFGFFWLLLFGADGGGTEDVHRFLINATARGFLAANHRLWGIRRAHEGASPALCVWLLPLPTKTIKRLSYNDYTSQQISYTNKQSVTPRQNIQFFCWFFPPNKHAIRIAQLIGLFERLMCKDLIQCLRNTNLNAGNILWIGLELSMTKRDPAKTIVMSSCCANILDQTSLQRRMPK